MRAKRLLLIGFDAADWQIIDPLINEGKLPHFDKLINGGVRGNMQTLHPPFSPCLWTSIATGKRMHKHGVLGFIEPDSEQKDSIRPVSSLSRKTKAIWNILSQQNQRSNVVAWWPSQPVEPIRGTMVSNLFHKAPELPVDWPVEQGMVHPDRLIAPLSELRMSKFDVNGEMFRPFIPNVDKIDQKKTNTLDSLAKILAETATVHAVATGLMQLEPWDFMAVYYDGIDHFSHGFMKYHPPKDPRVSDEDFEMYKGVVEGCYIFHDMMLGVLMQLAGPDTDIILISDHGFHNDHLRPQTISSAPAGPSVEHREYGIIVMNGPDFETGGKQVFAANLLDVAPTILHAFNMPVGRDMDGKVLTHAFREKREVKFIDSWDKVEGDDGMIKGETDMPAVASQAALRQLAELGYIERPDSNDFSARRAQRELDYNSALSMIDGGNYASARHIAQQLASENPEESRFDLMVFQCDLALGQTEVLEESFNRMEANLRNNCAQAAKQYDDAEATFKKAGIDDVSLLSPDTKKGLALLKRKATLDEDGLSFFKAKMLQTQGNDEAALEIYKKLETSAWPGRLVSLHTLMGNLYFARKDVENAVSHFEKAVELDYDCAAAHLGLARCYLTNKRTFDAATHALTSLELVYENPLAHFVYGRALNMLGHPDWAVEAFEMALKFNPSFVEAHKRIALICRKRLNDEEKAKTHERLAAELQAGIDAKRVKLSGAKTDEHDADANDTAIASHFPAIVTGKVDVAPSDYITVVTGLPRSGTSLAMQMLVASGIPALTDNVRQADDSNSKGYYELESVKGIEKNADWLDSAKGKAIKIVVPLVKFLPPQFAYKVIFMQRDIAEIMRSQSKMLERLGKAYDAEKERGIALYYAEQSRACREALAALPRCDVLMLDYASTIEKPSECIGRLEEFLSNPNLSVEAMLRAIDPNLYRERDSRY